MSLGLADDSARFGSLKIALFIAEVIISSLKVNACSMRAHEMEPKAQCSGRRRACTG